MSFSGCRVALVAGDGLLRSLGLDHDEMLMLEGSNEMLGWDGMMA